MRVRCTCASIIILPKPLTVYMSYCVRVREYICPCVNHSVLPLVVYPSKYLTVRHCTAIFCSFVGNLIEHNLRSHEKNV